MSAAELVSQLMAPNTSRVQVSAINARHISGRPISHAYVGQLLTAAAREALGLPEPCTLGRLVRALIRYTDTEEAAS